MGLLVADSHYREPIWSGFLLIGLGLFIFIRYGLTCEPLYFNDLNPWKKPLPVWAARLTYIPMGLIILYWGVQVLVQVPR
jgi:hypothetical protein